MSSGTNHGKAATVELVVRPRELVISKGEKPEVMPFAG
jgi:hypothetical protein